MDPVTLATITSAVTLIATDVAKGAAGEAGKALWTEIKSLFGWPKDPNASDLAPEIATKLSDQPELASAIVELLKANPQPSPVASILVRNIDAQKVVVAAHLEVKGDFNMGG